MKSFVRQTNDILARAGAARKLAGQGTVSLSGFRTRSTGFALTATLGQTPSSLAAAYAVSRFEDFCTSITRKADAMRQKAPSENSPHAGRISDMYRRFLSQAMQAAAADTPVLLLRGARQTGKTTLVRSLWDGFAGARYHTFDDIGFLSAAKADPAGFVAGLETPVILDEIQRVPELFLPIKERVDSDRKPGSFVLTGSADVLLSSRVADTLAGRMEVFTLWPLSRGEIRGQPEAFIDGLFEERLPPVSVREGTMDLPGILLTGGFPEVVGRADESRREAWFSAYLTTILERDIRDLSRIEGLTELPRILHLLAARVTGLLNVADISRGAGIPHTSLKRYLALLGGIFLTWELPAWSPNLTTRLLKSPKVLLGDTGLLGYLLGLSRSRLERERHWLGPVLENFVAMEVRKQIGWSRIKPDLFHFRTAAGHEVDLVMQGRDGRIVGIEVKASATVTSGDYAGLRTLMSLAGSAFHRGIVLFTGAQTIPFGDRLHAIPLHQVWSPWGER